MIFMDHLTAIKRMGFGLPEYAQVIGGCYVIRMFVI